MRVEDLFARQRDLHRTARELRELTGDDLVGKRIGLAAEAATDRRRDHADVGGRRGEHLRQHPVDIVRRLGRGPEGQLAVAGPVGDGGVLLHRQMRVALEEEDVLSHEVGARQRGVDVAELQRHVLVDVGSVAVLVDPNLGMRERVEDGHERV